MLLGQLLSATKYYGPKRRTSVCWPLRLELLEPRVFLSHTPGLAYRVEPVAFLGALAPGGGEFVNDFEPVGINNRGEVIFIADVTTIADGTPCPDSCEALFRGSPGSLSEILRTGEPAPGGGTLSFPVFAQKWMNDRGDFVQMWLVDSGGPGLYLTSPTGTITPIVVPGVTPAPGGGVIHAAALPYINNEGEFVFRATITTDDGIHLEDEEYVGQGSGVFKANREGQIVSVVSPGDPAPGGGTFDFALWGSAINDVGDVAFFGHTAEEPCVTLFPQSEQIHCWNNSLYIKRATGAIEFIVGPEDPSLGGRDLPGDATMNNRGQIAFEVGDVDPSEIIVNIGMYLYDNAIIPVAVPGDTMPGGGTLVSVGAYSGDHDQNDRGAISFVGTLDSDANTDGIPDTGVYVAYNGSVDVVARAGTVIPGVGTIAHITSPAFVGDTFGQIAKINDRGQVLFPATLASGEGVLLIASPMAAGDANGDFQFDQQDIAQVLGAAKYLTGQPATFEEGDWNGDGVFDQLDIVAALQTGNYLKGPYAARVVDTVFGEG